MKLRAWAEEGSFRSAIKVLQGNHFLKSLVSQFEKNCATTIIFFVVNGGKCRLIRLFISIQLYLPERCTVLAHYHDMKTSGNLGIKKTLSKIRSRYYWPGLQQDVRQHIEGCELCSKQKTDNVTKCASMKVVHSRQPMERIATDI